MRLALPTLALCTFTLVVGCAKAETPAGSSGSVVFTPSAMVVAPDGGAPVDLSASILATEIEVVRSERVVRAAARARGLASSFKLGEDQTVDALRSATSASRRGQSLVLEVSVHLADRSLAKESCNAILSAYVDSRMERRIEIATAREEWLRAQLDTVDASSPLGLTLRTSADEATLERTRRESDVTVLDACTTPPSAK